MFIGDIYIRFEFIAAAVLILLIVLGWLGRRGSSKRFAEQSAALEQEAMRRGWQFQGQQSAGGSDTRYHVSGETQGIAWQVESLASRHSSPDTGSDSRQYTRWWTEAVSLTGEAVLLIPRVGRTIQIGQRTGTMGQGGALAQMALRFLVTQVLHAEGKDAALLENVGDVQAGSDRLRQRFMVMASSEAAASRVLDSDAEESLVGWAERQSTDKMHARIVAAVFWDKGIHLTLDRMITDLDQIDTLARLGVALATRGGW